MKLLQLLIKAIAVHLAFFVIMLYTFGMSAKETLLYYAAAIIITNSLMDYMQNQLVYEKLREKKDE